MKLLASVAATIALATPTSYLQGQQEANGGWGSPQLTAWAALGLRAAGADTGGAVDYLVAHEQELRQPTEIALAALAEAALGHDPQSLLARLPARPVAVNAAIWHALALRQSGRPVPRALVSYLRGSQARSGGLSWLRGTAPDSNDTAAAIQALRAAGVGGSPVTRALAYLRRLQAPNGGFRLVAGRSPMHSPRPGASRRSWPRAPSRLPERSRFSRACVVPTGVSATRGRTRRLRCG